MKDDYPTETVSLEFFGDKVPEVGSKETVEIVSKDEDKIQIRCTGKGKSSKPGDAGKEAAARYRERMTP